MKNLLVCAVTVFTFFACGNSPQKAGTSVGGDVDEHGCGHAAGYTWSVVKSDCIRVFEAGVDLEPLDGVDKTTNAFAIFKSATEDAQAEIFMTGLNNSLLLTKNPEGKWVGESHTLLLENGVYTLTDQSGKALYKGAIGQ